MFTLDKSQQAFEKAKKIIPGGVNSPVRSFRSVGGTPPFIKSGQGAYLYDIDGHKYIDYVLSWGPMILGHANPLVTAALKKQLEFGTSYGAPTLLETELAEIITTAIPSIEMIRMVNSGTEATMSALRLARAYTKRNKIVKFAGCYHGHHDSLLVKAGSGATTFGVPDSPGVLPAIASGTITVSYNNMAELENVFKDYGEDIAAVIIEPVPGNMGPVLPEEGYLEDVRAITAQYESLLIFDEVMSGFRAAFGGAQEVYGITPDLTCLGKVIGGGLPVAAYGGRRDIMECIAPSGPVYQAGTLSGNPLAMTAGIVTLKKLIEDDICPQLTKKTELLCGGLREKAAENGLKIQVHNIGSMFGIFFSEQEVTDYTSALKSDTEEYRVFFHAMLRQGIYIAPSQFETWFMSAAHTNEDLLSTLRAADFAFAKVAEYRQETKK